MSKSTKTIQYGNLAARPLLLVLIVQTVLCLGCSSSDRAGQSAMQSERKLPKLNFHRPKNLQIATARLAEIHASLNEGEEIPAPIKFSVIELIHGTGASAHSHYNLAKPSSSTNRSDHDEHHEHGDDHEDDHEEMESREVIHEIEVDVFTEVTDLLGSLPKLAATAEVDESNFLTINKNSKTLQLALSDDLTAANSDSEKHTAFLKHSKEVNSLIQLLDSIVADQTKAAATAKETKQ